MYLIELTDKFNAVHAVRMAGGEWERPHEHDWRVRVFIGAGKPDRNCMVADFIRVGRLLRDILDGLEGRNLNKITSIGRSPTAELVARYVFDQLSCKLTDRRTDVTAVAVCEAENCWAWYVH